MKADLTTNGRYAFRTESGGYCEIPIGVVEELGGPDKTLALLNRYSLPPPPAAPRLPEPPRFVDLYRGWLLLALVAGAWLPVAAVVWIIWEIVR